MTDIEIIRALTSGDTTAYKTIYIRYYGMVEYMVMQNQGNKEHAKDVFQDTIIVLLEKSKKPGFKLTASLKTYVYSIARNIWFPQVKKERKFKVKDFEDYLDAEVNELASKNLKEEQLTLVRACLEKLGDPCKSLLIKFYYFKQGMAEIAKALDYQNADHAKSQKYKCMQRLKSLVHESK